MKQFFLFCFFALIATVSVQAQAKKSCAATCTKAQMAACAAKGGAAALEVPADASFVSLGSVTDEAAYGAAQRAGNVERVVNVEKKTATYMRKDVCAQSGKVSYANVEYCTKTKKFINVSPSAAAAKPACAAKAKGAACCAKGDKAGAGKVKLVKE